jgi:hypothetical protein
MTTVQRYIINARICINAPTSDQAQQYVIDGLAAVSDDADVRIEEVQEEDGRPEGCLCTPSCGHCEAGLHASCPMECDGDLYE